MKLVKSKRHGPAVLKHGYLGLFAVDGEMISEVVDPRDSAAKLSRDLIIVMLLVVVGFGEADGSSTGGADFTGESHAES